MLTNVASNNCWLVTFSTPNPVNSCSTSGGTAASQEKLLKREIIAGTRARTAELRNTADAIRSPLRRANSPEAISNKQMEVGASQRTSSPGSCLKG